MLNQSWEIIKWERPSPTCECRCLKSAVKPHIQSKQWEKEKLSTAKIRSGASRRVSWVQLQGAVTETVGLDGFTSSVSSIYTHFKKKLKSTCYAAAEGTVTNKQGGIRSWTTPAASANVNKPFLLVLFIPRYFMQISNWTNGLSTQHPIIIMLLKTSYQCFM